MKNSVIKLKSHDDLDGRVPGILAKLAFGDKVDVNYCSNNYIDTAISNFFNKKQKENTFLCITDISVNEENEKRIEEKYKKDGKVLLLDHHVTAEHLNKYEWANVKSVYDDGRKTAATSMFYEYLVQNGYLERTNALDEFVELVRQYDTWEWEKKGNFKAKRLNDLLFIVGGEEFESSMIKKLTSNQESFSLDEGEEKILDIEEKKIERYIHHKRKEMKQFKWNDYCFGVVYGEQYHSEMGNILGQQHPYLDAIVIINITDRKLSFRTIHDGVDVSKIAGFYGGGGHPKASGCKLTKEAFNAFVVDLFDVPAPKIDPDKNKYNSKESIYGTVYEDNEGKIYWIKPMSDGNWILVYGESGSEIKTFSSFHEAESYIKKNFSVWLSRDDIYISEIAKKYDVKEQTLRSQFEKTMEKLAIEN